MQRPDPNLKFLRLVVFGSLGCSIALAVAAWLRRELAYSVPLALVLATALAWGLISFLHGRGRSVKWALGLAVLNLLIVVPELGLRAAGFRHESGIEFGFPRPSTFTRFVRDEKLFWRMSPDRAEANPNGFPGRVPEIPKPDGLKRVVFLGDSCTQLGFPLLVEKRLVETRAGGSENVECIILAVAGYTSHQGRILAESYAPPTDPDVVVVFFGWNDHWLAYGTPDSEKVVTEPTAAAQSMAWLTERSRLMQLVAKVGSSLFGSRGALLDVTRVSHAEYRKNLLRIAEVFAERSVPVVFITAPTSHRALPVSDWLIDLNFGVDKESIVRLHTEYTDIVREVAQQTGQHLLDLEREFNAKSPEELARVFREDGIHYTPPGDQVVADRVAEFLAGLL